MTRRQDPLWAEVDRILYEVWDPIGVRGRAPRDEYRSYVAGIVALLRQDADERRVADHLAGLARVAMGVGDHPQRDERAASALVAARRAEP